MPRVSKLFDQPTPHRLLAWTACSAIALAVGACGGGNGSATPSSGASPAPAPASSPTPTQVSLSLTVLGAGRVASVPAGINCTANCSADFTIGSVMQLSAVPAEGYTFTGWSGACSGLGICNTTLQSAGGVTATFGPLTSATFPLRASSNKKFLLDAQGQPFLLTGDSAWSLLTELNDADTLAYLDDRKQRGFNAILIEMMEHVRNAQGVLGANAAGQAPFRDVNDFTTTNAAFFDRAAWVIQQAANRGMLVLATPSYIGWGCGTEGWCGEMRANGTVKLTQYGQFLGQRFRGLPNIVWVHGGDYTPSTSGSPSDLDLISAIMNGIKATSGNAHLHTAHWSRGNSSSEVPAFTGLDLDATYTGAALQTFSDSLSDWSRDQGVRPSFLLEGHYESEHNVTMPVLRAQIYQPVLSGSTGFVFGNSPMWFFGVPGDGNPGWAFLTGPSISWSAALGSAGARSVSRARQVLSAIAWQDLVPDTAHETLTGGHVGATPDSNAVMARSPDGRLALAYLTSRLTITVNLARFGAPVTATWLDPASGAMQAAAPTALANSGARGFTPPGNNSEGSADWLLLLQAN